MGKKYNVLDKGYIKLIDVMGSDLSVVNAARASYDKESKEMSEKDEKLISYLVKNHHDSPLRHASMTFEVYAPLMIARQWYKHTVSSSHVDDQLGWNESCLPGWQEIRCNIRGKVVHRTVDQLMDLKNGKWFGKSFRPKLYSVGYTTETSGFAGNLTKQRTFHNKLKDIWYAGDRPVYKYTTEYGDSFACTANHRILTPSGYTYAEDLRVGDRVVQVIGQRGIVKDRKIARISFVGEHPVYDIEMTDTPNFVTENVVVHNSRRYVTEEPQFYVPEFRAPPVDHKQGSADTLDEEVKALTRNALLEHYERSERLYDEAMEVGVAPEQARLFLPAYGLYVRWRWTASLQAVLNFMTLRLGEGAQHEITQYAVPINQMLEDHFPATTKEWKKWRVQ